MTIKYYPLDFDSLQKGDTITVEQLEEIIGHNRLTTRYNLGVLNLCERIRRELEDRGKHITTAVIKGALRLLTDEEAAEYTHRQFKVGLRKSARYHQQQLHVVTTNLSEVQRQQHERRIIINSAMLLAANSKRKELTAIEHKRSVPGIENK